MAQHGGAETVKHDAGPSDSKREVAPDRYDHARYVVIDDQQLMGEDGVMPFSFRRLMKFMGPSLLMCIAYIDPGNLESDLQAGAIAGYKLPWVVLWTTAMGYVFQLLAAKLGVVTGQHLAEHCRAKYPRTVRLVLWVMVELAIIGGDIQEVVGSAIAILLLSRGAVPLHIGVVLTAIISFTLMFIDRLGVRHLEALFAVLISVMAASFGYMYFAAGIPQWKMLEGLLVPRMDSQDVPTICAIMGAVIMPHNIFLHSALVHSRKVNMRSNAAKREAVMYFGIESAIVLVATIFINLFVLGVFAEGFYGKDIDIGLESAGKFLSDRFGVAFGLIWAVGLLAAGQASTMTGCYTGQFVMSGFLNFQIPPWKRVLITRSVALWPTLGVALLCKKSSDLDVMNQILNIFQSMQLPFALIPVMALTSSKEVMGDLVCSWAQIAPCWGIALLVMGINLWMCQSLVARWLAFSLPLRVACYIIIAVYTMFVAYLAVGGGGSGGLVADAFSAAKRRLMGQPRGGVAGGTVEADRDEGDGEGGVKEPLLRNGNASGLSLPQPAANGG